MLKKLALILIALCSMALAAEGDYHVVKIDSAEHASFRLLAYTPSATNDGATLEKTGDTVSFQVLPATGYTLDTIYATYGENKSMALKQDTSDKTIYSFIMPDNDVVVKSAFKLKKSSITIENCQAGELVCTFPKSATYGDTVRGTISGNFRYLKITTVNVGSLHEISGSKKDSIWFVMGAYNAILELDYELMPTRFDLKVTCNIEGKCNLADSANVGETVTLTLQTTAKYEKIEVNYTGLDTGKFKTVEKFKKYQFVMPENDVEFTIFGTLLEDDSTATKPDTGNVKIDTIVTRDTIHIKDTTAYYEVNLVKSDSGEIRKQGSFVTDHPNSTFAGEEIRLFVQPKAGLAVEAVTVKMKDGTNVKVSKDSTYKFTMPAGEVYVSATYKVATYKITLENCGDMKCEAPSTAKYGDAVTIKVTMVNGVEGYDLSIDSVGNFAQKQSGSEIVYTFTMPPYDVSLAFENIVKNGSGSGEGSSGSKGDTVYVDASGKMYGVTIEKSEKGTITRYGRQIKDHPNEATEGLVVSLFVEPEPGYALDSLIVKDAKGKSVKWTKGEAYYEFTMPASDVSVSATYKTAVYKVDVNCGDMKCELSKSEAKYGDKITLKVTLNGQKSFPIRHNGVKDLTQEQKGSIFTLTFTMPGHDVEISFVDEDDEDDIGSSDSKSDDGKSSSSKDDGKSSGSKDDGKSSSSKGDKGDSKDDGKGDGKGDKDAIAAIAMAPAFSAQIQGRVVYVSGATEGSAYALLNMNGSVIAKGRVGAENFNVMAPNAGKFLLRVGREVRTLDVK